MSDSTEFNFCSSPRCIDTVSPKAIKWLANLNQVRAILGKPPIPKEYCLKHIIEIGSPDIIEWQERRGKRVPKPTDCPVSRGYVSERLGILSSSTINGLVDARVLKLATSSNPDNRRAKISYQSLYQFMAEVSADDYKERPLLRQLLAADPKAYVLVTKKREHIKVGYYSMKPTIGAPT